MKTTISQKKMKKATKQDNEGNLQITDQDIAQYNKAFDNDIVNLQDINQRFSKKKQLKML